MHTAGIRNKWRSQVFTTDTRTKTTDETSKNHKVQRENKKKTAKKRIYEAHTDIQHP